MCRTPNRTPNPSEPVPLRQVYTKMETVDLFDVCVVGAGVEGSSTARYLASRGKRTLLLEQVIANLAKNCVDSKHKQMLTRETCMFLNFSDKHELCNENL